MSSIPSESSAARGRQPSQERSASKSQSRSSSRPATPPGGVIWHVDRSPLVDAGKGQGYGAFATRQISAGEIIIQEKYMFEVEFNVDVSQIQQADWFCEPQSATMRRVMPCLARYKL